MAFFKNIIDKAKKTVRKVVDKAKTTYGKIDKKVGGVLPGGPTPAEVRESKKVTVPATVPNPIRERPDRGVGNPDIKTPESIKPRPGESKESFNRRNPATARGSVRPQTFTEKIINSPVGQFVSGVKNALSPDPAGVKVNTGTSATRVGTLVGQVGTIAGLGAIGSINAVTSGTTAVSKAGQIGTLAGTAGRAAAGGAGGAATTIATNSVTKKKTGSLLGKATQVAGISQAVVGPTMAAIGTYPFSGFIREEALQTIGFAVKTAKDNGDMIGYEEALAFQAELINPDYWNEVIDGVPILNVQKALKAFYKAAAIKHSIDQRIFENLRNQIETGETDSEMYARLEQERTAQREAQRLADEEYYAQIEAQRQAAKLEERAKDAAYWEKILNDREKAAKKKREEEAAYWQEFYKELAKTKDAVGSSGLNFGLL